MLRKLIGIVSLLMCLALLPACAMPLTYTAEPIEAVVIDADTKQPVEGVIVVVHWNLRADGLYPGGSPSAGELVVMETVTDKDGKFAFPGWGPETVWGKFLDSNVPELILFKSGYHYKRLLNEGRTDFEVSIRRSEWNRKTIKMQKATDELIKEGRFTTSVYARRLESMISSLSWAYSRRNCEWKEIPRMVVALHLQAMRFKEQGIYSSLPTIEYVFDDKYSDPCGVRKIFGKYMP